MKEFINKVHPDPDILLCPEHDQLCSLAEAYLIAFSRWYRIKCVMSNFDMDMTAEKALELFKKEHGY